MSLAGTAGKLSLLVCVVAATGCASIVSKSMYPVTITSNPSGADITVQDQRGVNFFSGKTPATVTLSAGAGYFRGQNYVVTFSKTGYDTRTTIIRRGVDGWYVVGNFVFGGLIGWFIVDPATGAMWTLPRHVNTTLTAQASVMNGQETLHIATLGDVPSDLRSQLVQVK